MAVVHPIFVLLLNATRNAMENMFLVYITANPDTSVACISEVITKHLDQVSHMDISRKSLIVTARMLSYEISSLVGVNRTYANLAAGF
jgi:hypothetical protein